MSERATVTVSEELAGVRLDRALAVLAGLSRAQSRQMIDSGDVIVAGSVATKSTVAAEGALIKYPLPEPAAVFVPEDVDFVEALKLDEVIVVNKPAGLVVHPGSGNTTGTLAHGLAYRYPELNALGEEYRWGLVHRLDRDTSGLLLVARSAAMHAYLQAQLKVRAIGRTYEALVSGHLAAATGTIDAPVGRDPIRATRMAVVQDGRPARTHYRRLAEWEECSRVEVDLETGRTHQIRVHFASIGHGLVGDAMYGDTTITIGNPGRVWLHAKRLRFSLPDGGAHDVAADLPSDLIASLNELGESTADPS